MNKDYFISTINKHGEYRVAIGFILNGLDITVVDAKIDSGASHIVLPLRTIQLEKWLGTEYEDFYHVYKRDLIDAGVPRTRARGVIDYNNKDLSLMEARDVYFKYQVNNFNLSGVALGDLNVRLNCDNTGNVLLGTDVLSKFAIHVDVSDETGKETMIGHLRNSMSVEYVKEYIKHFGKEYEMLKQYESALNLSRKMRGDDI